MPGRRAAALAALVVAVAALTAIVAESLGGSSAGEKQASARKPEAVAPSAGAEVRNTTPQSDWKPHTGPVPILEYHVLGAGLAHDQPLGPDHARGGRDPGLRGAVQTL